MAFKIYNPVTNKWEVQASTLAGGTNVLDLENKFQSPTKDVEQCLSELKDDITETKKAIKYVYDHGGNGSGGGGGGSFLPTLEVIGSKEYILTTDQKIKIQYSFTSNNRGNGFIQLTGAGNVEEKEIAQGKVYEWQVGPFAKGKHNLSLNVRDSQGFWSGVQAVVVNSGALEILDQHDHDVTYLPGDTVEIPYVISTAAPMSVNVSRTFNGNEELIVQSQGSKIWSVKLPNLKGIYKASLKAMTGDLVSNTINYTLIAADSDSLLISSSFPTAPEKIETKLNQNIVIDYTNSMLGQPFYDTFFYIDDMNTPIDQVRSKNGRNYWVAGDRFEIGEHRLKIKTVTSDGQHNASLEFILNVTSSNFTPHPDVKEGLIAYFEATGNMNSSETRHLWRNRVAGSNIGCELFNYNYNSNGWAQVPKVSDLPSMGSLFDNVADENRKETVLRCSGKSYAVIDYAPFINGINKGRGMTFEIVYRAENTGNPSSKIVSCMVEPDRTKGFDIDTDYAQLKTSYGELSSVPYNENEWTRMSFVINRAKKQMYIYCNGVLSGFSNIEELLGNADGFKHDGKIILGAAAKKIPMPGDPSQTIDDYFNFSNCDIRTVRIYNRALSSRELLDNFIADVKDEQEQLILRRVNGLEEGFEETIPTINILNAGNIDASEMPSPCIIDYRDPKNPDKAQLFQTCTIQWQGTSSLEYPIKNYTVKIQEDGKDYYGWSPVEGWKPEARWTLKANYMDSSQSNNVGSAKFIHDFFMQNPYPIQREIVGSRTNVDGFPVVFMVEGVFKGIYTFNIDRYSYNNYGFVEYNNAGIGTKNPNCVSYEFNVNNSTVFELDYSTPEKELVAWNDTVRFHMKHRYNGKTGHATEVITSGNGSVEVLSTRNNHEDLLDLLKWMSSFKNDPVDRKRWVDELKDHFSIPHLIDYWLIANVFGMIDNLGKNLVLSTYGKVIDAEGNQLTIWYPNFYDGDSILGLNNVGANVVTPGAEMSTEFVTKESRLWKWLVEDPRMWDTIKRRYMDLRSNIVNIDKEPLFSLNNLMSYVGGRVSDTVGQKFYNEDFEYKYLTAAKEAHRYMCQGSRRSYIERWLRERLIFLDSLFGFGDFEQQLITMRSNTTGPVTLAIKTYSPQKTSILFQAGSEPVVLTTNKHDVTNFTFNLTNNMDNEIKIKGAKNIMVVDGFDKLNLSVLKLTGAERLTNVELAENNMIRELVIGSNKFLRTLDVSDCKYLGANFPNGTVNQNKILDLSTCENLRTLLCNNTSILGVTFPEKGGVIDEMNLSNTGINVFKMTGQEYLKTVNLSSCAKLTEVLITKCDGLINLQIPKSALAKFNVEECRNLENVDISYTNQLNTISIVECPNVKKLIMKGVSNNNIQELNLSSLLYLEELDISSSSSIKHIVFGKYNDGSKFNKLKILACDNSTISSIRYGLFDAVPNFLDLGGLPLEEAHFDSCKNLIEVRNIKLVTSKGEYLFNECSNLVKVTGELTFTGSMQNSFQNCRSLTSLPTGNSNGNRLDLSGVTSMSQTFWRCVSINMAFVSMIMSKVSSNLTYSYRMFASNPGIVTNDSNPLPSNLFANCTRLTTISEFFIGCNNIGGGLHADILKPMGELNNCYYAFGNTKITGGLNGAELPESLFRYNTKVTTTERMFHNTSIKTPPNNNMFANLTNLSSVYGMFSACYEMIGEIPPSLFRNNPNLLNIGPFFHGTKVYGPIPRRIFDTNSGRNNLLVNVESCFNGCDQVTGEIPAFISNSDKGIFDYSPNLSATAGIFSGCSGLKGIIPPDIFKHNLTLTRINSTFAGCSGIGSEPDKRAEIPANLLKGKLNLVEISYLFSGCTNIRGVIPEGFLEDCQHVTNISGMFQGCRELVGQIPQRESRFETRPVDPDRPELGEEEVEIVLKYGLFDKCKVISTAKEVFSGCSNLNSFIPETLFISGYAITDLTNFFANCYRLQGSVPEKLFNNCTALQITDGMFLNCVEIKRMDYAEDDDVRKYALPPKLFERNRLLTSTVNMFRMDGGGIPHSSYLIGEIPDTIFRASGTSLRNVNAMFHCNPNIKGVIGDKMFENNTELRSCYETFGETSIVGVGRNLFRGCNKLSDLRLTFDNCSQLTGEVFDYLNMSSVTQKARCFGYCTKLNKYAEIKAAGWAD